MVMAMTSPTKRNGEPTTGSRSGACPASVPEGPRVAAEGTETRRMGKAEIVISLGTADR